MSDVKHLLGISGGKDSAALAVYLKKTYPSLDIEYYTCDTGKELDETYELIERLNSTLGKKIVEYTSFEKSHSARDNAFDHFLDAYGHFLPSSSQRWCTKKMKLEPFERHIGTEPTISYVGIRGDEMREGYISKKENVQSIFPFRKNIWSQDVIKLLFKKEHQDTFAQAFLKQVAEARHEALNKLLNTPLSITFNQEQKTNSLLDFDIKAFNHAVHAVLKNTDYPVGQLEDYPLLDNTDILKLDDIFDILKESGVGVPAYYLPVEFSATINGKVEKSSYNRSRSGCFFCFFQQKIEWVWLLEQHPRLFQKALDYEKDGYTWAEEPLAELMLPARVEQIKVNYIKKQQALSRKAAGTMGWKDEILEAEGIGCTSCFV